MGTKYILYHHCRYNKSDYEFINFILFLLKLLELEELNLNKKTFDFIAVSGKVNKSLRNDVQIMAAAVHTVDVHETNWHLKSHLVYYPLNHRGQHEEKSTSYNKILKWRVGGQIT